MQKQKLKFDLRALADSIFRWIKSTLLSEKQISIAKLLVFTADRQAMFLKTTFIAY